jgi:hypothetical protein
MPSRDGTRRAKPAEPDAFAGRRPRPELAGNRAQTLGALVLHARTLPRRNPGRPRAELEHTRQMQGADGVSGLASAHRHDGVRGGRAHLESPLR